MVNNLQKYRRDYLIIVAELLLVIPFIIFLNSGCAHSVDYETQHDTDTVVTNHTPHGPAFIRFLAVLDNAGPISLKTGGLTGLQFVQVQPSMDKQYIPITSDSSMKLYATFETGTFPNFGQHFDSLSIPNTLDSFTLTSVILFQSNVGVDTFLTPFFANDSLKNIAAPAGMCYLRLVNGISDFPSPSPSVTLYLDDLNNQPVFKDNSGNPEMVTYGELHNYVLVPAGQHTVYAAGSTKSDNLQSTGFFSQGKYYTARFVGSKANGTAKLAIDEE